MSVLTEFKAALAKAKHIVVLAGAGLSAASGIPTFRGAGGLWRKYDAMSLATSEAFEENPSLVWQFYHYRRHVAARAHPNAAHKAIALLSASPSDLHAVAPFAQSFILVTQNVDGLSGRALPPNLPKESQPVEMHGSVFRVKCTKCVYVGYNYDDPICPALGGTEAVFDEDKPGLKIEVEDLPKCPECGALSRPGVVWFGETVDLLDSIYENVLKKCDLLLVIGTSSTVYPASGFAEEVQEHGAEVAVFNLERTKGDEYADFLFIGPCEDTLPKALGVEDKVKG
ncbi:hypothetical protein M422DRAFT_230276 [Sphaerobolus stellatus SS14]|uniref:NAD-dependent protein deacylase n=1 Tax=Sphaerobolus stellatus (strain SS14) TaxID=990650 RepID=A0A0C9UZS3_SPHS4|nr:hypothetical protein M422DRAFT_230276 [Sphaerobolus stellatus SS14]